MKYEFGDAQKKLTMREMFTMVQLIRVLNERRNEMGAENCIDEETGLPFIEYRFADVPDLNFPFSLLTFFNIIKKLDEVGLIRKKIRGRAPMRILFPSGKV